MGRSDEPTPEQLSRLPVWARERIEYLSQRLTEHQAHIAELSGGPADSDVLISYFGTYPDHMIGIGVPVRFQLGDRYIEVRHSRASGSGDVIEIYGSDDALHVTPQSSNVVRVRIGEY